MTVIGSGDPCRRAVIPPTGAPAYAEADTMRPQTFRSIMEDRRSGPPFSVKAVRRASLTSSARWKSTNPEGGRVISPAYIKTGGCQDALKLHQEEQKIFEPPRSPHIQCAGSKTRSNSTRSNYRRTARIRARKGGHARRRARIYNERPEKTPSKSIKSELQLCEELGDVLGKRSRASKTISLPEPEEM